jgi:hypothetical protein
MVYQTRELNYAKKTHFLMILRDPLDEYSRGRVPLSVILIPMLGMPVILFGKAR